MLSPDLPGLPTVLLTTITPCMLQDLQEPGHITLLLLCLTLCVVQVRVHPYLVAAGQDLQEPGHHHLADAVFDLYVVQVPRRS